MDICVSVRVTGRVQGVWFRQSTKKCADKHRVNGWCRNNQDGSVEAVFSGEENAVNTVVKWCQAGPTLARVDTFVTKPHHQDQEFSDFKIIDTQD